MKFQIKYRLKYGLNTKLLVGCNKRGRSGTLSDLAELAFFVYFFSGYAFQRNK
jgi:hypothetical protein